MKSVGILGLPQSGKSTLFEILMQGAGSSASDGAAREHVGIVRVPDDRVDRLSVFYEPKKTTHARITFVDSPAMRTGSARALAKGPDLFAGVRQCDALLAVVRDFENPAVPAENGVDPERDLRNLEAELILNDLAIVEKRAEKLGKEIRVGKKEHAREHALLERVKVMLEAEKPLRAETFDPEDHKILRGFTLLTLKPLLAVYNQDEARTRTPEATGAGVLAIALKAHIEREIVGLPPEEREAFRKEMGVEQDGLSMVIRACYDLLGLISFFTVGPDEVRAWTIHLHDKAVDAAGEIHSDLARGFIRAEVIAWDTLLELGGQSQARDKGLLRAEGRDYEVKDGECLEVRFSR
jgi:GTP-binding protein YchF